MIRHILVFTLIPAGLLQAQPAKFIQTDSAVRARIVSDLTILASDSFQGRESGTPGEKMAYEYIISQFRDIGLEPKGSDIGSYLQPFRHQDIKYCHVTNQLIIDSTQFMYMLDFGATCFSGNSAAKGKIMDIGYGISLPGTLFNDPSKIADLKGKIVLMNAGIPEEMINQDTKPEWINPVHRIRDIVAKGAAAVILWNRACPFYDSLFDFTRPDTLACPVIFVNSYAKWFINEHPGAEADIRVKIDRIPYIYNNVIGYIDNQAEKTIITGAHYDHIGINRRNDINNGADDNASGTAGIMELARYMMDHGNKEFNYLFIAFSGEEKGLFGSEYFCNHPTTDLNTVYFMLNFDMIGRLGCEGNVVTAMGVTSSPQWKQILSETGHKTFHLKKTKAAPAFSDHYAFLQKGIPIAYFTSGDHPEYHTPKDKSNLINYDGMVSIIRFSEDFIQNTQATGELAYHPVSGIANTMYTISFVLKMMVNALP
ncbi:MAG: M28 family peptidase [Bacteroidetes bacterium]|nr:M28 family peptidase [Bacteroidota bacterium]